MSQPFVSVIIPCFNEEKFIGTILGNLMAQDYPRDRMEVLVMDGGSTDRTLEIIRKVAVENPLIRVVPNEQRYVPFALNAGIKASRGEVIMIMGAHTFYPPDYVPVLVKYLFELNADNVGAFLNTRPGDDSNQALAISKVLSSPFGIGNAKYRTGVQDICRVDTVPFGCYRREVFEKIGFFDEELLRNQDYEFNARLIKSGGSIYLIPFLTIDYFTRSSTRQLFRMHYQYGLYNPLVSLKVGRPMLSRHLVPLVFLLFLVFTGPGSFFFAWSRWLLITGSALYLFGDLLFTAKIIKQTKQVKLVLYLPWIFFFLHLSYGWGYLMGIFRFLLFKKQKSVLTTTR
jgi:glycosyltransferase involved in cell wall biosynthesis